MGEGVDWGLYGSILTRPSACSVVLKACNNVESTFNALPVVRVCCARSVLGFAPGGVRTGPLWRSIPLAALMFSAGLGRTLLCAWRRLRPLLPSRSWILEELDQGLVVCEAPTPCGSWYRIRRPTYSVGRVVIDFGRPMMCDASCLAR
uniref:Uncharacterized protein n=1 Tax=Phytophthora infestans TaxID=4787 RepID=Q572H2_PHYIN|nr:hypothetical protein PI49.0110c [Phytophthora infestans]